MKRQVQQLDRALRQKLGRSSSSLNRSGRIKKNFSTRFRSTRTKDLGHSNQGLGNATGGTNPGASQAEEILALRSEFRELMRTLMRMSASAHAAQKSSELFPDLQEALRPLGARVDVIATQAPTPRGKQFPRESPRR